MSGTRPTTTPAWSTAASRSSLPATASRTTRSPTVAPPSRTKTCRGRCRYASVRISQPDAGGFAHDVLDPPRRRGVHQRAEVPVVPPADELPVAQLHHRHERQRGLFARGPFPV